MPTPLPGNLAETRERDKHTQKIFNPNKQKGMLCHQKWKSLIPFLEQISSQYCVQVLLWDVLTRCFIYEVDKRGVTGNDASFYSFGNDVDFLLSNNSPYSSATGISLQQK